MSAISSPSPIDTSCSSLDSLTIDSYLSSSSSPASAQIARAKQAVLNVCLPDHATFANFYVGDNQDTIELLRDGAMHTLPSQLHVLTKFIYMWGERGCGRTHLLLACCDYYREKGLTAAYAPFKDLKGSSPRILENFENMSLLCFDDLDVVIGYPQWEEAIFHCFNRLQQQQRNIIVTTNATPYALPFGLRDLQSRMTSGIIREIKTLTDEQKIAALQFRANQLGLTFAHRAAAFLVNRSARDTTTLFTLLRRLDQISLQEQRRLTVPFIKSALGI